MPTSSLDSEHVTWTTHIFTTHEFWTGAFVSGLLSSGITYFSTRDIAARRAQHEVEMQDRKDKREDRLREEESLYSAAQEFAQVATEILTDTIDIKGTFNVLRDALFNRTGQDDPKTKEKFEHSEKVAEAQKRIAVPMNKLKMLAPTNVLDVASKVAARSTLTTLNSNFPSRTDEPAGAAVGLAGAVESVVGCGCAEDGADSAAGFGVGLSSWPPTAPDTSRMATKPPATHGQTLRLVGGSPSGVAPLASGA
jgi:hypothetical protein